MPKGFGERVEWAVEDRDGNALCMMRCYYRYGRGHLGLTSWWNLGMIACVLGKSCFGDIFLDSRRIEES